MKRNHGHKGAAAVKRELLRKAGKASLWMPLYNPEEALKKAGIP